MKKQPWLLFVCALGLMAGTAGLLAHLRTHERLAPPGVKTHPLAGLQRVQVELPERVLDYTSEPVEVDKITLATLPKDTSFGQRRYEAPDHFMIAVNAVLMGTDRTSLHKPQFCLEGQGCRIDQGKSEETTVRVGQGAGSYELPVVKLVASREVTEGGQKRVARVIYVYWYVADDAISASISGFERMWLMASELLRTGVLQRWAYISCLAICAPGQEQATFERMKTFIGAAVPQFQLTRPPVITASAGP